MQFAIHISMSLKIESNFFIHEIVMLQIIHSHTFGCLSSPALLFVLFFTFQDIQRYKLGNPRTFHYLNQSNCYELDGIDDSKEYIATRRAMDVVGIGSDEQVN